MPTSRPAPQPRPVRLLAPKPVATGGALLRGQRVRTPGGRIGVICDYFPNAAEPGRSTYTVKTRHHKNARVFYATELKVV